MTQVRLQNAENQRKQNKERAVRKLLKKITTEKSSEKPLQEVSSLKAVHFVFSAGFVIRHHRHWSQVIHVEHRPSLVAKSPIICMSAQKNTAIERITSITSQRSCFPI